MSSLRRCGWLWLAAAIAPAAQAELRIDVDPQGLSAAQIDATYALVEQVAQRLPLAWMQRIDAPIQLQWRTDLPAHVHGRAIGRRVLLDRALLDAWSGQATAAQTDLDTSATRAVTAAVVHELAHVLDRGAHGGLSRDPRLRDLGGSGVAQTGSAIAAPTITSGAARPNLSR